MRRKRLFAKALSAEPCYPTGPLNADDGAFALASRAAVLIVLSVVKGLLPPAGVRAPPREACLI